MKRSEVSWTVFTKARMMKRLGAALVVVAVATGCSSPESYTSEYRQALTAAPAATPQSAALQERFRAVFEGLQSDTLPQAVDRLYAEELYFNDTFETIRERAQLKRYLVETGEKVDVIDVRVRDWAVSGHNVYVRWAMRFEYRGWPEVTSRSSGVTHLRVNERNRVVVHQDYWDGVNGYYREVPLIAPLIEAVTP